MLFDDFEVLSEESQGTLDDLFYVGNCQKLIYKCKFFYNHKIIIKKTELRSSDP